MTTKNEDKYEMNLKDWPHLFTKTGKTYQIGENDEGGIFAVEMTCTHCSIHYVNGQQTRPPDPCPARNERSELKRLLS